jgi:chromosome segregation ATPase
MINSTNRLDRIEALIELNSEAIARLEQQQEAALRLIARLSESEDKLLRSMEQLVNFSLTAEERAIADRAEIRGRLAALEAGMEQHQQMLNQILRRLDA